MFSSVAYFNNQIFILDLNGNLIAYEYIKFYKKKESQNFKEKFRLKLPLPDQFIIKNIVLDVVEDFASNLKCLLVVAISLYIDISVHLFYGNTEKKLIHVNNSDWLPLLNVEPNFNLFTSHGPTLLFTTPEERIFCYLPNKIISRFNAHISDDFSFSKVIHFASVGTLNIENPINVILLMENYENPDGLKKILARSFGIKTKEENSSVICHEIPMYCFFPAHFQNSTEMVHVWNISIESQISNLDDVKWSYNYSFISTNTDSLLFCNGTLKYIFIKSDFHISYIKADFYEMPYSSINLVIVSRTKDVYFVSSEDTNPVLQLNKSWENIEAVLCGDILMNGSKQLLLLKNTSYDKWQEDYVLSDVSDFVPVDYVVERKETECCLERAMPGIQAKILAGKEAITNTKFAIEKKMEATLDSLCELNSSAVGNAQIDHHISSFRGSLVDIILSKDEVNQSKEDDENKVKLTIQKQWKQLCQSHIVLYWTLSNDGDRIIYNPVLNMWIPNHHIQCLQRVVVHKSLTFSIDDEFRKQIDPNENFTIIVRFEIPEFSCEELSVQAVLSWYIGSCADFENELYLPLKEKTLTQQQMCLQTKISSDEIFSLEFKDISTYEDLMCMKILHQRVIFIILSLVTDLYTFEDLVVSSPYQSNNIVLLTSSNRKILVFNKANQPLYGVHMAVKRVTKTSLEVEVFTKNEQETSLVEKYLYKKLPSDVLILANGVSTEESIQMKQQAVCCMKDELDLLLSMLNIHNVQEPMENCEVQPGTVVISKENFLRIRKALLKKECSTDNIMQILSGIIFFRKNE